jgi:hypothetical protein
MTDITAAELSELLTAALNTSGTIRPGSRRRVRTVEGLIARGLLVATRPGDVSNLAASKPTLRRNATVRLTASGRAVILGLDPASCANNRFWPLPGDVERAQGRLKQP